MTRDAVRMPPVTVVLLVVALLVAACNGRAPAPGDLAEPVEVFAGLRGDDAEALREVLADFTARTGIATRYVGTAGFARRLPERLREGAPPDVALVPQPALLAELARSGHLAPLDGLDELEDTLPPGAFEVGIVDDVRYGVWYRVSPKSLVWYPPAAFEEAGYELPRTWDELLALSRDIAADGTAPWCLGIEDFGSTGWVGTDWIEDLVLRLNGPVVYDAWVAGEVPFTDPRIAAAFDAFGEVTLTPGMVAGGTRAALTTPALEALWPMLDDTRDGRGGDPGRAHHPGARGTVADARRPTGLPAVPAGSVPGQQPATRHHPRSRRRPRRVRPAGHGRHAATAGRRWRAGHRLQRPTRHS